MTDAPAAGEEVAVTLPLNQLQRMRDLLVKQGVPGPYRLRISPDILERIYAENWVIPEDVTFCVTEKPFAGNRHQRRAQAAQKRKRGW
jgi:hypothetical protein